MFSDQPHAMSRKGTRGSHRFTMDSIVLAPGESCWGQRLYIAVQSGTTVPVVKGAPIAGLETQIVFKRRVREEIRRRSVVPLCSPINLTRCRERESVDHNGLRWTPSFLAPGESCWGQRLYIAVQSGTTVPVVKGAPITGLETQIVFKRRVREEIRRRSVVLLCSPINLTRCHARESVDHNGLRWTPSF